MTVRPLFWTIRGGQHTHTSLPIQGWIVL